MEYSVHILPSVEEHYYVEVCDFKDIFTEKCLFHTMAESMDEAYKLAKEFIKKHKEEQK